MVDLTTRREAVTSRLTSMEWTTPSGGVKLHTVDLFEIAALVVADWEVQEESDMTTTPAVPEPAECPHDTIASSGGIRACFDCGEPNPKRVRKSRNRASS